MRNKIITGWWGGEPIWRWETPEEMLLRESISQESASLYIAANETLPSSFMAF